MTIIRFASSEEASSCVVAPNNGDDLFLFPMTNLRARNGSKHPVDCSSATRMKTADLSLQFAIERRLPPLKCLDTLSCHPHDHTCYCIKLPDLKLSILVACSSLLATTSEGFQWIR